MRSQTSMDDIAHTFMTLLLKQEEVRCEREQKQEDRTLQLLENR